MNIFYGFNNKKVDIKAIYPIKSVGGVKMDIAALSISLHQSQLMQQVSLAVTKQAMDMQQQHVQQIAEAIESVPVSDPNLGNVIDISI